MSAQSRAQVAWSDLPGPERFKMFHIYTPTVDRPVNVVILSEKLLGVYVHYYDRRTRPCTRPSGSCHGCEIAVDRRWKGYLAAFDPVRGRQCIAELTREAFDKCPALAEYNGHLRGFRLRLDRMGQARNSRVQAKLTMPPPDLSRLPPLFDLAEALEHVWWTDRASAKGVKAADVRFDDFDGEPQAQGELFSEGGLMRG